MKWRDCLPRVHPTKNERRIVVLLLSPFFFFLPGRIRGSLAYGPGARRCLSRHSFPRFLSFLGGSERRSSPPTLPEEESLSPMPQSSPPSLFSPPPLFLGERGGSFLGPPQAGSLLSDRDPVVFLPLPSLPSFTRRNVNSALFSTGLPPLGSRGAPITCHLDTQLFRARRRTVFFFPLRRRDRTYALYPSFDDSDGRNLLPLFPGKRGGSFPLLPPARRGRPHISITGAKNPPLLFFLLDGRKVLFPFLFLYSSVVPTKKKGKALALFS